MAVKEGMKVGPDKVTTPLFIKGNNWNLFFTGRLWVPCFDPPELDQPDENWLGWGKHSCSCTCHRPWSWYHFDPSSSWSGTDADPSCFQSCQRGKWSWASLTSAQLTSGGKETKPMSLIMIKVTNWQSIPHFSALLWSQGVQSTCWSPSLHCLFISPTCPSKIWDQERVEGQDHKTEYQTSIKLIEYIF